MDRLINKIIHGGTEKSNRFSLMGVSIFFLFIYLNLSLSVYVSLSLSLSLSVPSPLSLSSSLRHSRNFIFCLLLQREIRYFRFYFFFFFYPYFIANSFFIFWLRGPPNVSPLQLQVEAYLCESCFFGGFKANPETGEFRH